MKSDPQNSGQPDITLHDVMAHQQHHFGQMRESFRGLEIRMDGIEKRMGHLENRMDGLEQQAYHIDHRLMIVETKIDNMADTLETIERIPLIGKEMQKQWKR